MIHRASYRCAWRNRRNPSGTLLAMSERFRRWGVVAAVAGSVLASGVFLFGAGGTIRQEQRTLPGLKQPVEILRDRWGVPHIYAQNTDDLFFANGYMNARDRLFQIDLWRRTGTGKLAEVLGPQSIPRDRMARLFHYRGDVNAEWQS